MQVIKKEKTYHILIQLYLKLDKDRLNAEHLVQSKTFCCKEKN